MLLVIQQKILCGIVNFVFIKDVVLTGELVLYVLTQLVSTDLGLAQLFNSMKTTCIRELPAFVSVTF